MSFHTTSPLRRHATRVRAAFIRLGAGASLFSVLALAACAGGDGSPTEPVTPPVVPPPVVDPGPLPTGIVSVVPTGLPSGVNARVTVKLGATTHLLVGTSSIAGLIPGSWTATAQPITADGITYLPEPETQNVNVAASATATVTVAYAPNTGTLNIIVSGLPAGGVGSVVVTGPDAYRRVIGTTTSLSALTPGQYHLEAAGVRLASGSFAPSNAQQDVDIAAGNTAAAINVTYVVAPSIVKVAIGGLPGGGSAAVKLTPPSGSEIAVTASTRLAAALAGRWQLAALPVKASGFTWTPSPAAKDTTVASGDSLSFNVQYSLSTGAIAFLVSGLPNGVGGAVTVTGPGGYQKAISETATLTDLASGVYTVRSDSLQSGGTTYRSTAPIQQITVSASLVATPATVTYSAAVANLTITLRGVPVGASNVVEVSGPGGFDRFVSGSTTFGNVSPGKYTVTASPILLPGGVRYAPTPATAVRTLAFGSNDSVEVTYARAGGKAVISVLGLPAGVNAAVTLTGNDTSLPITSSVTLDNLAPDSYTISALAVTVDGTVYYPSPVSASLFISVGGVTNSTVTYTAGVVPPPGGSGLNLVMDGFYLTQAVQKMDGSVPLVAGRDALLRVFVHASETNALHPPVRVRIYDGATLLQTLTLSAPEASVRTSLSEGTLNSTWNSLIPAVNVRPAMRIVADVDPSSVIAESDETDNSWPRSGTPLAMAVNTVPTFNVRFVPVTVGALTGNVTTGNKDQFLVATRRIHPINDVVSDVRAPFTSSAAALQAGDGNNAWLTVLSEMNALRSADGAPGNLHYYGVVKVGYNSGVAGYGYVPGRAAIGWDYLPSGDEVAVHEWGHNFGRPHTNCGGADSWDPLYPYAGGVIGQWGWNPASGALVSPTAATDVMGYCSNQWTSDWTWTKVMAARATSGMTAAAAVFGAKQDALLVWGRIVDGKVTLEPAFRVTSRPTPAAAAGTHRLQALDSRGQRVLDLPITAERVDHAANRDERQFAVVIPWSDTMERTIATLRVSDVRQPLAAGSVSSATVARARLSVNATGAAIDAAAAVMPVSGASVTTVNSSRTRVQWNQTAYPMVVARDATTGEIMAFVRKSGDDIVTAGRKVELVFSDGVRTRVEKVQN